MLIRPDRRQQVGSAISMVHDAIAGDMPTVTRSPEATADIVSAVANGRSTRTIVNLPNTGQIDNLPRGAVVETLAEITSAGALRFGQCPVAARNTISLPGIWLRRFNVMQHSGIFAGSPR